MASYPVEIRRCQHIRVNGTQCGSPALREKECCYFHQENRPVAVRCYMPGEVHSTGTLVLPVFEDAHSIQAAVQQVSHFLLERRIDHKTAGLLLYAMQIASSNLKQMQAGKPRPTQVVVDPEKVAETPMGMTPWSASGQGHDPEEDSTDLQTAQMSEAPAESEGGNGEWRERFIERLLAQSARVMRMNKWLRENPDSTYGKARAMMYGELRAWARESMDCYRNYGLEKLADEVLPLGETPAMVLSAEEERLFRAVKAWEERTANLAASIRGWLKQDLSVEELRKNFEWLADEAEREVKDAAEGTEDDPLAPQTIQACAEHSRYVV